MTPIKAAEMRKRYEHQYGKNHGYTYWSATRELTTVPDDLNITAYVVFKVGDRWCWGMTGDAESIKRWRWDTRHLRRPYPKAFKRQMAHQGEKTQNKYLNQLPKHHDKWKRFLNSKTQHILFEVADLVDSGMAAADIARKIEIPYEKVYYYVKKYQRDPHLFVDRHTEQV